jgi:hypothetical protein
VIAVKAYRPGVNQGNGYRDHSPSMAGFDGEDVRLAVLRRDTLASNCRCFDPLWSRVHSRKTPVVKAKPSPLNSIFPPGRPVACMAGIRSHNLLYLHSCPLKHPILLQRFIAILLPRDLEHRDPLDLAHCRRRLRLCAVPSV